MLKWHHIQFFIAQLTRHGWQCDHIGATAIDSAMPELSEIDVLIAYPLSQTLLDVMTVLDKQVRTNWQPGLLPYVSSVTACQFRGYHYRLWVYPQGHEMVMRCRRFVAYLKRYPEESSAYFVEKQRLRGRPDYHQFKANCIRLIDQRARHVLPDFEITFPIITQDLSYHALMMVMQQTRLTYKAFMPYYMSNMQFKQTPCYIKVCSPYEDQSLNYLICLDSDVLKLAHYVQVFNQTFKRQSAVWYLAPMAINFAMYQKVSQSYQQTDVYVGYVLDLVQTTQRSLPGRTQGIGMRRVLTDVQIKQYYAIRPAWGSFAEDVIRMGLQACDPVELYVGYMDNKPVVSLAMVVTAGVIGMYGLQVCAEYRRLGIAQYVVNWAIQKARLRGYRYVVCQAGAASRGIVTQVGFKPLCQYIEYGNQVQSKITLPA